MSDLTLVEKIIVWTIPVLFAITVHEVAHGWVASRLGDQTAKSMGRLTLNPLKHIDPIGTVVLPLVLLYIGGFIFGWAKPVPVNWQNLRHPRRDMALVAAAGPCANLVMLVLWALLAKLLVVVIQKPVWIMELILIMSSVGITINIILMVLNLFPLLPLDGGRIMTSLLPPGLAVIYSRLERFGLLLLVLLIASGVLGNILGPVVSSMEGFVYKLIQ
jgi:Zn-dependent protease